MSKSPKKRVEGVFVKACREEAERLVSDLARREQALWRAWLVRDGRGALQTKSPTS